MGWSYTHKPKGEKVYDFLVRNLYDFNHLPVAARPEILAHSGKFHFMAFVIKVPAAYLELFPESGFKMYEPESDGSIVTLDVVLTRHVRDNYNFGWKSISEAAGPYESVPVKYLEMLSSLNDEPSAKFAKEYRERCRRDAALKKGSLKIKDGCRIEFENPVVVRGRPYHVFEALTMHYRQGRKVVNGRIWRSLADGLLVRLSKETVSRAKILSNGA